MSQVKNKKVNLPHPPVPKSEKKPKKPYQLITCRIYTHWCNPTTQHTEAS